MSLPRPHYLRILDHKDCRFPPVELADEDGLLAIGGNLHPETLIDAYSRGIFPWYSSETPILWWSPDPRFVLFPERIHISKTLAQFLRKKTFEIRVNTAFEAVLRHCAEIPRAGQDGTWLTPELQKACLKLQTQGYAYSIEVWENLQLIGGLYGIKIGSVFCGESMFSLKPNASKAALVYLCKTFAPLHGLRIIDCQVYTEHLECMGAVFIPRSAYLMFLK